MNMPADQRLLYRDLVTKLDTLENEPDLIRYMGEVLHSLLRRRGDAEFLRKVQDAFTTGLPGLGWDEQTQLARQVIGLVITKRPEIASAWQKLNQQDAPSFARRASDQPVAPISGPDLDDLPEFALSPEEEDEAALPEGDDPYAQARTLLIEDMNAAISQLLGLFAVPEPRTPSPVYDHDHPFFLFTPQFPHLVSRFLGRLIAGPVRAELELEVFARLPPKILRDEAALRAALTEARPQVCAVLVAQLGQLINLYHSAQTKIAAAESGTAKPTEYRKVKVPVSVPRVIHVLGLNFTLGHRQALKTMRIPVEGTGGPDAAETEALTLADKWSDMAMRAGLSLPESCDFTFLRALLQTDPQTLSQHLLPLLKTAADMEGDHQATLAKLNELDTLFPPAIVEAAALTLFRHGASGCFGFQELVEFAHAPSPRSPRRLVIDEIGRRPRDLAFQIRDALRSRMDRNRLGLAIVMLFEVWRTLDKDRFNAELQAALTVFSAFPVAFAGDPAEKAFSGIGLALGKAFEGPQLEAGTTVETVLKLYGPVLGKE